MPNCEESIKHYKLIKKSSFVIKWAQIVIYIISLFLLIMSLTKPAFYISRVDYDAWSNSSFLFFLGWSAALGGAADAFLIWLANPICIIGLLISFRKPLIGFCFCCLASILAFSFSQLDSIVTSESGATSSIKSLELGYKFWLASILVLNIGTAIGLFKKKG